MEAESSRPLVSLSLQSSNAFVRFLLLMRLGTEKSHGLLILDRAVYNTPLLWNCTGPSESSLRRHVSETLVLCHCRRSWSHVFKGNERFGFSCLAKTDFLCKVGM